MNNKQKSILVAIIIGIIVVFGGITYAFFSTDVFKRNEQITVQTGTMKLTFNDEGSGLGINKELSPGESIEKLLSIENTGTLDAHAIIYWDQLVNSYSSQSLTYKLLVSSSKSGDYKELNLTNNNVPHTALASTLPLSGILFVPTQTTKYYKLVITLENIENVLQNSDYDANLSTKFTLESVMSEGTVSIVNENAILTYGLNRELIGITGLTPGVKQVRTLMVTNTKDEESTISLAWKDLINTYSENAISFNLKESNSLDGNYTDVVLENHIVPVSDSIDDKVFLSDITLDAHQTKYYKIEVTLDEHNTQTTGSFVTTFTFGHDVSNGNNENIDPFEPSDPDPTIPTEPAQNTIALLVSNGAVLHEGSPTSVAALTDEGLYAAPDDKGTSYYFRGAVENNYVKFGQFPSNLYRGNKGSEWQYKDFLTEEECLNSNYNQNCAISPLAGKYMWWRIVRVNGNGSIRMIYDGTEAHENGEWSDDRLIEAPHEYIDTLEDFEVTEGNFLVDDAKYVGYMYGPKNEPSNTTTPSLNKISAETNTVSSNIKTLVEYWYENVIVKLGLSQYLSDEIYCNDRSTIQDPTTSSYDSTLGYGQNETLYGAFDRLYMKKYFHNQSLTPTLKCDMNTTISVDNDKFTVASGKLKYPVGLLTADEMHFAGSNVYDNGNTSFYLYKGHHYDTMTPAHYMTRYPGQEGSYNFVLDEDGVIFPYINAYLRPFAPVINLRPSVSINLKGKGTISEPYEINQ